VRIRHANGYETAYAHMSRFARGIRAGSRVRQGQVIGYVGTTGRSTGPHLHYEVSLRGSQVNPMSLRVANGRNLTGRALELFMAERARIDTLRHVRDSESSGQEAGATPAGRAAAP
jgi:murein DD-endopeptidase MepM/ murein hydrolase activator NlpD